MGVPAEVPVVEAAAVLPARPVILAVPETLAEVLALQADPAETTVETVVLLNVCPLKRSFRS